MIKKTAKKLKDNLPSPMYGLARLFFRITLKPFYERAYLPRKIINIKYMFNSFRRTKDNPNINLWERKVYSQNGEDGIIERIFDIIGTTNKYFVEFGTQDAAQSNTRYLRDEKGWKGLLMDGEYENKEINLRKEFVTAENVEKLFRKYKVPKEFDLLSIDIDGNDYWVWKAIKNYKPRVVVVEYNSKISKDKSRTIEYSKDFVWRGTDYMGASLLALSKLGKSKGYRLLSCDNMGVNAFFVRGDLSKKFKIREYNSIYRRPVYGTIFTRGHPSDKNKMVEI